MFWNRIGSLSGRDSATTGTLEEGKDIFFSEYTHPDEWEEMVREHLVAYLDGSQRWNVDRNRENMRPELALLNGNFMAEGVWEPGKQLNFSIDLDGDGNDEIVRFRIDFHGYWLNVFKNGSGLALNFPEKWDTPFQGDDGGVLDTLSIARIVHVAIKDVTNDGLLEVIVAAHDGVIGLRVAVWGFRDPGTSRDLSEPSFCLLGTFEGQHHAMIYEGGRVSLPYGTAGLSCEYEWDGREFAKAEFAQI